MQSQDPLNRLGIITALPIEARCLTRDVPSVQLPLYLGEHAVLALSGMGADKATRAAERLAQREVTALASIGFAGALDPTLVAGDVLLPETVIGADGKRYDADETLHAKLRTILCPQAPVTVSPVLEVRRMVDTPDAKAELRQRYRAVAVDMESAAVARVARAHRLPFFVLRVVLDESRVGLPASLLASADPYGRLPWASSALTLITRPSEGIATARLMRALPRARSALRTSGRSVLGLTVQGRTHARAQQA